MAAIREGCSEAYLLNILYHYYVDLLSIFQVGHIDSRHIQTVFIAAMF
jgi:hypothetical protein